MDGGLSRPSMASEALGLLPDGNAENAGAIFGRRCAPPSLDGRRKSEQHRPSFDRHGWRPLSAIHGLRGTWAPARRKCRKCRSNFSGGAARRLLPMGEGKNPCNLIRALRSSGPSPSGRGVGVRVGPCCYVVECPDPHPALRATFSRREKGSRSAGRRSQLGIPSP